ncbi:CD276 antigen [Protopterus annectens]|uniref:CD276 antigen n=1 Tax=Protopterus annectens TaxID=7888 RepID=UPI001CF93A34|nr:CD276 antigen [Protopterus annectens]
MPSLKKFACEGLFLRILTVCLTAALDVKVPDFPVIAMFGQDVTLNCSFTTDASFNITDLNIIWQLTDTSKVVHKYFEGSDQLADQSDSYANRTRLFPMELPNGNASLLLQKVQISDETSFTCFVRIQAFQSAAVALQVAAPYSKPYLVVEPSKNLKPGDEVTVSCHTFGGYPEASVLWQDGSGRNITENVTTSQVANEKGLFEVRSTLTVLLEPNSTYSCIVSNELIQENSHVSVTITGQHLGFPAIAVWVSLGLAVCLVVLLIALAYVCYKKIKESCQKEKEGMVIQDVKQI